MRRLPGLHFTIRTLKAVAFRVISGYRETFKGLSSGILGCGRGWHARKKNIPARTRQTGMRQLVGSVPFG